MLECSERNPSIRRGSMEFCLMGELLGVYSKSYNNPHRLEIERLMNT